MNAEEASRLLGADLVGIINSEHPELSNVYRARSDNLSKLNNAIYDDVCEAISVFGFPNAYMAESIKHYFVNRLFQKVIAFIYKKFSNVPSGSIKISTNTVF